MSFLVNSYRYPASAPVTLTADAGTFTLTGVSAALTRALMLQAAAGAFALMDNDAALTRALKLQATAGAFALTGNDAAFAKALKLQAAAGSFVLTDNDADLTTGIPDLVADAGTFTLTGNAAALSRALRLAASSGSFSLTGNTAALHKVITLLAGSGSFALTGVSNTFKRALVMAATQASFTLTGNAATLSAGSWRTTASASLGVNGTGFGSTTVRQTIAAANLANIGGSKVRLTFRAGTGSAAIDNVYIGHKAASGDAYDFESTPTQITFSGGSAGATVATNSTLLSDEIAFTIQSGKDLIVAIDFGAAAVVSRGLTQTGWQAYRKSANDASTVNATGYSAIDAADCLSLVESFG
ncbi:hypothetical protein E0H64_17640 [Rhizobium leguminosarum bv. viciae]|uniref:hypothetical protein n=1 Tax=Rhizobium TaxID=379 RepID=UPI00103F7987|nr:hypothetical protein [Rhizobium leguminosarum]TBZ67822.1 hypothetical protein E0H64_17640 [Rhizobium leguminosarum bv. viciae]